MSTDDQAAGGRGDARWWRPPRVRLQRPTAIRNGGLLLILVALAAVMALVDQPGEPGGSRRLPWGLQHLPPPVGITQLPPAVAQPPPAVGPLAGAGGGGTESAGRRHPLRLHPRPDGSAASSGRRVEAASRPDGGGVGASRPRPVVPPVTTRPAAAAPPVRVRVPAAAVRVTPPRVPGRELPAVQVETPAVQVETRAR